MSFLSFNSFTNSLRAAKTSLATFYSDGPSRRDVKAIAEAYLYYQFSLDIVFEIKAVNVSMISSPIHSAMDDKAL